MKKSRLAAVFVGAVMVLAGVAAVAAPASAATSNCPTGSLCIWGDSGFRTDGTDSALVSFASYIPNYSTWNYSGKPINANNSASSIYNNGRVETAFMYNNTYKTGFMFSIPRGNSNSNLLWAGQNDKISSGYYASFN